MERSARVYETARIGDIDIHYHLADYTDPWRKTPAQAFLRYSGYCRSLEFWHAWVPLLARDYRVLRMDPRGYGHSGKPAPGYKFDIEQLARDALELMDHLGIERVHWVGDSTGGAVGMVAALLAPKRVSSITACNTTAKMAQQTVDTYAIGEKDQAAAIEKHGVYEWCRNSQAAARRHGGDAVSRQTGATGRLRLRHPLPRAGAVRERCARILNYSEQ